jgi:hypothetical protein
VLTWDLLENFLLTHYGRMEDPEVLFQQLDKLTLASTGGSIATYVSKFVTILARLGMERPNRENVHAFLKGLPAQIGVQMRLKFAGENDKPLQAYIDALCLLPDYEVKQTQRDPKQGPSGTTCRPEGPVMRATTGVGTSSRLKRQYPAILDWVASREATQSRMAGCKNCLLSHPLGGRKRD